MDDTDGPKVDKGLQQINRFKEAAHALGCDEDEAAFDQKLKDVSKPKPKNAPKPSRIPRKRANLPDPCDEG